MPKKVELSCPECENEFTITYKTKEPVSFCPFCSQEIDGVKTDRPLLKNFEELDEFDERDYYDEEEEELEDDE